MFGLLALLVADRLVKLLVLGVMGTLTLILLWWLARDDKPASS
jgi:hypothetical protein